MMVKPEYQQIEELVHIAKGIEKMVEALTDIRLVLEGIEEEITLIREEGR